MIKQIAFLLLTIFILESCGTKNKQSSDTKLIETKTDQEGKSISADDPIMTFEHETWDFGNVNEPEIVSHKYEFKNTGKKPLLISTVEVSCGCTAPDWSRNPILPGESGFVELQFKSEGKKDKVEKSVSIISNATPVRKSLSFTAFVNKRK